MGNRHCGVHASQSITSPDTNIHQLCVRPTGGGGKTLLFNTIYDPACLKLITLCITLVGAEQAINY